MVVAVVVELVVVTVVVVVLLGGAKPYKVRPRGEKNIAPRIKYE